MTREGMIMDEQPHVHLYLSYTAFIFRPILGGVLCGTVNIVGVDHVGCLLYDCINVTVRNWQNKDSYSNFPSGLEEGSSILFKVVSLDASDCGLLSLTGDYFKVFEESQPKPRKNKKTETDDTELPKRKKRKRNKLS